tara:strand:- start:600 stop:803 length:204 start_codon:yes stop_codon:yes gene_type:complete
MTMKYTLLLLFTLLLASCGMTVTYEDEKTGIRVTEVINGKVRPVIDFSRLKWGNANVPEEITITPSK